MLDFFRRHQRYFFIFITIVIVISFSFFGTYDTLSYSPFREQIAFKTVDGQTVTRHELDEMATFIGTDALDKRSFGGLWGPNFLNDGVIRKNFLETGLAVILASAYPQDLQPDLLARLEKEKRYSLYVHPQAGFVGTAAAWNYFAPAMTNSYNALKATQDPTSPQALQARTSLFLMEKQFPQHILRQVLRYQEKQHSWITPDRNLDNTDLSLFGYHTMEDWFGPRFVRLTAEFIMNAAAIAEAKGYEVTKEEALADLMRNADTSFQQLAGNPHVGVATSHEYFNEQLRHLGMDKNGAANLWRQVMLFRLLFQDMGSSVFVDPYTFEQINGYAMESVEGELYRLPKELRLADFRALQKFEMYLDAISKRSDNEKATLALPTSFLPVSHIAKKAPALVQKHYQLEMAQANKKNLEGNVVVKDSWNWEVSDNGWDQLKKQFPELAVKKSATRDERFTTLDALDSKTRERVDAFARAAIVDEHPEWLTQALEHAPVMSVTVGLNEKGGDPIFVGLKDGKALMQLLDAAPLASQNLADATAAAKEAADQLSRYSANQSVYYRIQVIARGEKPEVLTFAAANEEGILDDLVDAELEAYYLRTREEDPKAFQNSDLSWKPFADVKDILAERYFANTLAAIRTNYAKAIAPESVPDQMIPDYAATLRLYPYVKQIQGKIQKDPSLAASLTRDPSDKKADELAAQPILSEQWKLEKVPYHTSRSNGDTALNHTDVFALAHGGWTKVNAPANGDLNFFHLTTKGSSVTEKSVLTSVNQTRSLVSADAQQQLMRRLLVAMQEKGALSLAYLQQVAEINQENLEELDGN